MKRIALLAVLTVLLLITPAAMAQCTDPQPIPDDKIYLLEQVTVSICLDMIETYDAHFGGAAPADQYEWAELMYARYVLPRYDSMALSIAEAAQAYRCGNGQDTNWSAVNFSQAKTNILPIFELLAYAEHGLEPPVPG